MTADGLAERTTRLIWAVLLDAGRRDLVDAVADRLARMHGGDLRIRAVGALRAVFAGLMADQEAEDFLRRGLLRDELALLTDDDRRLVQHVREAGEAGRRRARRLVADVLDRVARVLNAPHSTLP